MGERGLRQQGYGLVEVGERLDVVNRLDAVDGVRGDRHGADRLLVALVADVDDLVALARSHLHLVVHLGHERAHRVDHEPTARPRRSDHFRSRAVSREHHRPAWRHFGHVVDEDNAEVAEALHD